MRLAIVIPALDEEATIGHVIGSLARELASRVDVVVLVADNGSLDRTKEEAERAGALVVSEPRRGYGSACLAAISALPPDVDIVVFADADGADDPRDLVRLVTPVLRGTSDLVVGSRLLGEKLGLVEPGALHGAPRWGNRLASFLLRHVFGAAATDLGPFRAISRGGLARLSMDDRGFGWTVQMQARAARLGLRLREIPVRYRQRKSGRSKISGSWIASARAGVVILAVIAREARRAAERATTSTPGSPLSGPS
jgi:glycosyltransferase involved in cell wall biosynthesis